jgi:hypothetical protein
MLSPTENGIKAKKRPKKSQKVVQNPTKTPLSGSKVLQDFVVR